MLDFDPSSSWYTLETEHFAVHFSSRGMFKPEQKELVEHVARLAEDVHAQLTALIGWAPASRTQVVISESFDYANGWAAPLPDNTITLLLFPPAGERSGYDDWLRTLLVHEYCHVIQMDMARGLPRMLRRMFGRAGLTNPFVPVWLLEGYALHTETRVCGYGRAESAEFDMMVRAAADAGVLLPIDRCCNYELMRWPAGSAPYLYGSLFCRYIAARAGQEVWDRFSLARSSGLPFFDNWYARRLLGAGFDSLWREWQAELNRHADSVSHVIQLEPLTSFRQLTEEGFYTGSPLWSRSGEEVYYISNNGTGFPAIKAVNVASRAVRVVFRGRVSGNLSLSADGRWLAFSQFERNNYSDHSDIFCVNLRSGELRRLTRGMRARDPDYSPDGRTLAFISVEHCRSSLMLMDLATGEVENLVEGDAYAVYSNPRFSPDGRYVTFAVGRPDGHSDIEILDRLTGWVVPVTEDAAVDLSPCWSRTGRHLFFVSDRSGVFNLYAFSLETRQVRRCTNVLYGAFGPAVSPSNRELAVVLHSFEGDDIAVTSLDARTWGPALSPLDSIRSVSVGPNESNVQPLRTVASLNLSPVYYYNPFPTILPKLWLPFVWPDSLWSLGAFTFGWDALQIHRYSGAVGYRPGAGPFMALEYRFNRFLPLLRLRLNTDPRLQTGELSFGVPALSNRRSSIFELTGRVRRDTAFAARYMLGFATSNAFAYRFDVAPREGAVWGAYSDLEARSLLGQHERVRVVSYVSGFVGNWPSSPASPVFSRWSVRLRAAAGSAFGDASRDSAWQTVARDGIFGVRGPRAESVLGCNTAAAGVEYRMPISWLERGLSTAPVFLRNLNGALFADWRMTWSHWQPRGSDLERSLLGLGAEIRADLVFFHLLPASFAVGYARGVRPAPANTVYFRLESSMLGELMDQTQERFEPVLLRD